VRVVNKFMVELAEIREILMFDERCTFHIAVGPSRLHVL